MYENQGKLLKRDIIFSWLDANGVAFEPPQAAAPLKPEAKPVVPQAKVEPPPLAPQPKVEPPTLASKPIVSPQPVLPGLKMESQPLAPKSNPEPPPIPESVKPANAARKETRAKLPDNEFSTPVQRFPFPPNVMITGGSGFIVDGGRKVVTNRHVIEDGKEFAIRTGLGEVIKVRVVFISQSDDIAVLELEKPLPPVDRAGFLQDVILAHQLAQNPRQALLGDAQNAKQFAHRNPRPPPDKMQHAMMRAPHIKRGEDFIRAGGEIAIAKEQ